MAIHSNERGILTMFQATQEVVTVTMKSKRLKPFVAIVQKIKFDGQDDVVIFQRCPETIFPDETDENKSDTYTTLVKNVKDADLFES